MQYIADIKSGTTPKERDENLKNGIILLKTNDIRNNILQDKQHDYFYIDEKTNNSMKSSQLKESDILINIVGATTDVIGRVSFVPKYFPKSNITQAMSFIRVSNSSYNAETLFIFLQSKFGNKQTRRIARPTGQYNVNNEELGSYKIPLFSLPFQGKIETMVKNADQKLGNSKMLYTKAENLLISELGLENFNPSNEKVSIKTLKESFLKTGRLDSEYYQPKYDDYLKKVFSYSNGYELLGKCCNIKDKNFIPKDDEEYCYIELANVRSNAQITDCNIWLGKELPTRARRKVNTGDVIVSSIEGSLENCALITEEYNNSLCSTGFYVVNSEKLNSESLLTVFKSSLMLNLMKKSCSGTILTNIAKEEFAKLPIPLLKQGVQDEIAIYIKQSMEYSKKAKELLEISTKSVEIAIDKDEETAYNFLEQNRTEQNRL